MLTEKTPKKSKFVCNICEFITNNKKDYEKHVLAPKHQNNIISNKYLTENPNTIIDANKIYECEFCNKKYKSRVGLWQHLNTNKNKCTSFEDKINATNSELGPEVVKLLAEIVKGQNAMQETVIEMVKNGVGNNSNNITNTNSHNKTFNLQVFLNDTCKGAMNLSDFISSIKPTLEDLERTGQLGYVEGISSILINNLNSLEEDLRPIHCSDLKRETLYVKENDTWKKDADDNALLKTGIKNVAMENMKNILEWKNLYPECTDPNSKKNDKYLKIVSNSMAGTTKEEIYKNINKIVSNVAKKVFINKCK